MKNGKVIAIEPSPRNLEILRENVIMNRLENVEILPYALSNTTGSASFTGESASASIMTVDESSLKVQTITMNEILKTYCRADQIVILKMNIGGAEELVFKNPQFLNRVREIALELHGKKNIEDIPRKLIENGFKVYEFTLREQVRNTLKNFFYHPLRILHAEIRTNLLAMRGAFNAILGKKPVLSIGRSDLKIIYAVRNNPVL